MVSGWDDFANQVDSRFLILKAGANQFRIISSAPFPIKNHYIEARNRTTLCSNDGNCLLCKMGYNSNQRYAVLVFDRESKQVKIWEGGIKVFRAIATLHKSSVWGDPRQYDIVVEKTGQGKHTTYTPIPQVKQPLTPAEVQEIARQIKDKGLSDLKEILKPPTVEQVRQLLGEGDNKSEGQFNPAVGLPETVAGSETKSAPAVTIPNKDTLMDASKSADDIFKKLGLADL